VTRVYANMAGVELHCMQGRLLPPREGRIQGFPVGEWDRELALCADATVDGIEWIYEVPGEAENPLGDAKGRARLRQSTTDHGVAVRSVCADWFMDRPLARDPDAPARLRWLIGAAAELGVERIVVPCVDESRLHDAAEQEALVAAIGTCLDDADDAGVELHFETDLAPEPFAGLLSRLDHPLVCANYDIGNSASLGYDPREEWDAYGGRIGSVHVKDRLRGGTTVPLGSGDADLATAFAVLRERGWDRPLVLQVARGDDGDEVAWVRTAADAVRTAWEGGGSWTSD
jgi:L-ribulose-5-phosphate 3-epimerase